MQHSAPKPLVVTAALSLLWVGFILRFGQQFLMLIHDPLTHLRNYFGFSLVLAVGALWLYCVQIGQNWARILLLVVTVVVLFVAFKQQRIHIDFASVPLGLRVVSVALLFTPPANAWFRGRRRPNQALQPTAGLSDV